jgi:RimJ/RimL family protein N-acetyltransferase
VLQLVAVADDTVVGSQGVRGRDFATLREVSSGSWVGRRYQGNGFGTHMRAAVLHLAFAGLSAGYAISAAFTDNAASLAVSRKLAYADDGLERHSVRGGAAMAQRLRLDRAVWQAHRTVDVDIHGLAPCLPLFGVKPPVSDTAHRKE